MKRWYMITTLLFLAWGATFSYAQAQDAISAADWAAAGMSESNAVKSLPAETGNGYHLAYVNTLSELKFMCISGTNLAFVLSTATSSWKVDGTRFYPNEASGATAKMYFYKDKKYLKYDATNSKYIITGTSAEADNRLIMILTGKKGYVNGTGSYGDGIAEKGWDSYPMVWYEAYLFYKTAEGNYIHVAVQEEKLTRINTAGAFDATKTVRLYAANGQRVLKLHRNENPDATAAEAKAADDYTLVNFNVGANTAQTTAPYNLVRAGYTFLGWSTDPKATKAETRYAATNWPLSRPQGTGQNRWGYEGVSADNYVTNLYAVWYQEKVWKLQYGYNATVKTATFTTDPTDTRYMTAMVEADADVIDSNGKVEFKLVSEATDGTVLANWGFTDGANHEPGKNGSWSTFSTTGASAEITACKNTATYTLRLDVSDANNPQVTVLWPYVISVSGQSNDAENGMWAFAEGEDGKWTISDWTMPSVINNMEGESASKPLWVGRGEFKDTDGGHSAYWSFGWIPFTRQNCAERTMGNATGALGTLQIDANSTSDNYGLSFDPVGYGIIFGEESWAWDDQQWEFHAFTPTTDPNIWETEMVTSLTSTTGKKYHLDINTIANPTTAQTGHVCSFRNIEDTEHGLSEKLDMTTMQQKKNASEWYDDNLADKYANRAGKFRIDLTSCNTNLGVYFVPYIHAKLDANAPEGQITQQSWAGPALLTGFYFSVESTDEQRTITMPAACPWTRTGYVFKCWDTDPYGLGRTVNPGETLVMSEDLIRTEMGKNDLQAVLYAQWLRQDHVTFHRNLTESDATTRVQQTIETQAATLDACAEWKDDKTDFAIAGWALTTDGNIVYEAGSQIITMGIDVDLYAVWRSTVTVTYNENRGDAPKTYSEEGIINTGYDLRRFRDFKTDTPSWDHSAERVRFARWNTQANGMGTDYEDGDRITLTGPLTLYAQWDQTCTVTYYPNGADYVDAKGNVQTPVSVNVLSGQDYTLKRNGYKWKSTTMSHYFVGWATNQDDADAGIVTYHNQQTIKPTGNLDLYAVWRTPRIGDTFIIRQKNGDPYYALAQDNSTYAISSVEVTGNIKQCFIWVMEDAGNGTQFYLHNYLNSAYYLCCQDNGTISLQNDGTKTAWNLEDANKMYYLDANSVRHYLTLDASAWTTATNAAAITTDILTGDVNQRYYLTAVQLKYWYKYNKGTTIYPEDWDEWRYIYDTFKPYTDKYGTKYAHPVGAYYGNSGTPGSQTLPIQFTKNYEQKFHVHDEAGNWNYTFQSLNNLSMEGAALSENTVIKTETGFTLAKGTTGLTDSNKRYTINISVTPKDVNLENIKSLGKYVDYVDSIIVSATVDTMHLTQRIPMTRRTAYTKDDDLVTLSCKDSENKEIKALSFTYNDVVTTVVGTVSGHHLRKTNRYYACDDSWIEQVGNVVTNHDLTIDLSSSEFTVHIADDATGKVANWAEAAIGTNTITVRMLSENTLGRVRTARLVITNRHKENGDGEDKVLLTSLSIPITQGSRFMDNNGDLLVHNKGVVNTRLDERGLQQVHTQEQTLYYIPGEQLILDPRERHMAGWQLWYDYDNLTRIPNDIAPFPSAYDCYKFQVKAKDNMDNMGIIGDGEYSQGVYGIMWGNGYKDQDNDAYIGVARVKLNIPNDWTGTYRYAGDFSAYMDYGKEFNTQDRTDGHTGKMILEPTLSYRQVWTLRPALEMAAKMEQSRTDANYWVEDYHIAASVNGVTLTPNYHTVNYTDKSQLGYIFQDAGGIYHRVGDKEDLQSLQVKIYKDGVEWGDVSKLNGVKWDTSNDYIQIKNHTIPDGKDCDTVVYSIKAGGYKIARFTVIYYPTDKVGPMAEDPATGKAIITNEEIKQHYLVLSEENFDYNRPKTDLPTWYKSPLKWEESSSGFYYPNTAYSISQESSRKGEYPFRGEYGFVNTTKDLQSVNYMATFENRSGVEDGYMLMTDAPSAPGLMAMLNVEQHLCSGQKMYCSAWVGNLNSSKRDVNKFDNPTLRFDIRGRNNGDSEWTAVSSFFTGEIAKNVTADGAYSIGTWYQINFEIDIDDDYDNYQIAIYDFASSGVGNDFVLDDIIIYANELPLEAYQASTSCSTTSVKSVIRVDYEAAKEDMEGYTLFYQVWNKTNNTHVVVEPLYRQAAGQMAHEDCGTVAVPNRGATPTGDKFASLSAMIQQHDHDVEAHQAWDDQDPATRGEEPTITCMGFVKEQVNNTTNPKIKENRWILYIVHDAPMTSEKEYEVRVAYGYDNLNSTECALTAKLPVTNAYELLVNGEAQTSLTPTTCGNDEFQLSMNVNTIVIDPLTGKQKKLTGQTMNDWLLLENRIGVAGSADADPTAAFDLKTWRSKALHKDSVAAGHGYTFDEIERALVYNLRKDVEDNPNRFVTSLAQIDVAYLSSTRDYQIIHDLLESGELTLGNAGTNVYMHPNDLVRYAVMPVIGSAYDENGDQINMCYSASIVAIAAPPYTVYKLDNGKTALDALPEQLKGKPIRIRVGQNQATEQTVIMNLIERNQVILPDQMVLDSSTDPDCDPAIHWFAYEPNRKYNFGGVTTKYYDSKNDTCILSPIAAKDCPTGKTYYPLKPGYEYTFRIELLSSDGLSYETRGDKECAIGVGYFTLAIVPDYLRWTPGVNGNNNWQDDANWTAVDAMGKELGKGAKGYVPGAHTNVIIPLREDGQYPVISKVADALNDYDMNYEPATCHAIYFEDGGKLGNQADLAYDKAFADLTLTAQKWYIVSVPLQETVSGDMAFYIDGSDNEPFAPKSGETLRTYNTSFISTYSNSYTLNNPENTQWSSAPVAAAGTGWSNVLNSLSEPLKSAQAFSMMLWRGDDAAAEATVRLPRTDNKYYYYYENGDQSPYFESIERNSEKVGKFAFTPNDGGNMSITLTNTTASEYFAFGNPTMAYIDLRKFLEANKDAVSGTFYYMADNATAWEPASVEMQSSNPDADDKFTLAPMRGVMIKTKNDAKATSITVTLSSEMLTIYPGSSVNVGPARKANHQSSVINHQSLLTLSAENIFVEDDTYRTRVRIGAGDAYSDSIVSDEDLLMMSANAGTVDDGYFATPLNMYVLDNQHALSVDMRRNITCLPLLFNYGNGYTPGTTTRLWVHGASEFDHPLYLCDTLNNTRTRLQDGMYIDITTPEANTLRYYILGVDNEPEVNPDPDMPTALSATEHRNGSMLDVQIVPEGAGRVGVVCNRSMLQITAFDIVGKEIKEIQPLAETASLSLHEGVYVLEIRTAYGTATRKVYVH